MSARSTPASSPNGDLEAGAGAVGGRTGAPGATGATVLADATGTAGTGTDCTGRAATGAAGEADAAALAASGLIPFASTGVTGARAGTGLVAATGADG